MYYCRSHLVILPQLDKLVAHGLDTGSTAATNFAIQLIQQYLIEERQTIHVTENDLFHTIEMLVRISSLRSVPDT